MSKVPEVEVKLNLGLIVPLRIIEVYRITIQVSTNIFEIYQKIYSSVAVNRKTVQM